MAIPTLAMIPSGYKAGKLYSVLPSDGTGDFTVARASAATRVNQSGLIEQVAANVPRLDYSAGGCPVLLTEISSTNICRFSQDFSNALWNAGATRNVTFVPSPIADPEGQTNAYRMTSNASDNQVAIFNTITSGLVYTNSIYVKRVSGTGNVALRDVNNGATSFPLSSADGWKRISVTASAASTIGRLYINLETIGDLIDIWGGQTEEQPAATSYIKTTSTAQTRDSDLVDGAGSSATFNSLEHTFFVDLNNVFENGAFSAISILASSGTLSDNRIMILKENNDTEIRLQIRSAGSTVATETLSNIDFSVRQKLAVTVKLNEVKYYRNGFNVATDSGTIPLLVNLGQLALNTGNPTDKLFASTKDIRYYNQVLTAAETLELMSYNSFNEMASALQYTIK